MQIVIDGDSILYRVAFRGEELGEADIVVDDEVDDDGLDGLVGDTPEYAFSRTYNEDGSIKKEYKLHLPSSYDAVHYAITEIVNACVINLITEDDRITDVEIHMSGRRGRSHCDNLQPNFRHDFVDDYKELRKDSRAPAGFNELWDYIFTIKDIEGIPCNVFVVSGAEADDTVVYLKTTYPDDVMIVALDKDVLYQSVGHHYNYGKQQFVDVTPDEARRFLYYQMLVGDPSDGYKGVPGVGKVGAHKALDGLTTEKQMFDAVLALYKAKGLGLGECLQTGILASMHQVKSLRYEGNVIIPEIQIFKRIR